MSTRRSHGTTSKSTSRRPYFTLPRCVLMALVQHAWELRVRPSAMHKIQQLGSSCHVFDRLTWRACQLTRSQPLQLQIAAKVCGAANAADCDGPCLADKRCFQMAPGCDRSLREARAGPFFSYGGSAPPTSAKVLLAVKSSPYTWQLSEVI